MALTARYLADKSAHTAAQHAKSTKLTDLMLEGLVASSAVVNLELLYSARSRRDYEQARSDLLEAFETAPTDQQVMDRALEIQRMLAAAGKHRTAGVADLIIAATAEGAGLTLLHCDRDFEAIVEVTGQPHEMVDRPSDATPRNRRYVILVGEGSRFQLAGQVDAISPTAAIEEALRSDLMDTGERQIVAVEARHWQPVPASGDPGD